MKRSTMTGGFQNDPSDLPPEAASGAVESNQEGDLTHDSVESPSEATDGAEGTDEPPPAAPPTPAVSVVMPSEPGVSATSGEILKFLDDTAKARKAIRKAEDDARSSARKIQDAADKEVDKAWRGIMRLKLAKEAREKALTPSAQQLPLE